MFGEKGAITDCSLKYTRSGHFRNFAFIGFRSEIEAQAALDHFNQSYLDTRKLQVCLYYKHLIWGTVVDGLFQPEG